ncbi:MAG TPA: type II toxin-antitoxin system VapC family toxin [Candidatus Dormibacteraeota bacterium]|nr:type II toxin-antitoxin system VapC family toxin [Candidatus Dormibacteraeota bacterium]
MERNGGRKILERTPLLVVDVSVGVKWFVKEPLRRKALEVRKDYAEGRTELTAPSLLMYEVGNALRFHPVASPALLVEALATIDDMQMVESNFSDSDVEASSRIAFEEQSTFYDATYLALAEKHNCLLLTDDRVLYKKTRKRKHLFQLLDAYRSSDRQSL